MTKSIGYFVLLTCLFMLSLTVCFLPVRGQGKTIVVPDNCQTIGAALVQANDGDTIQIKAGIYNEHTLNITKTLKIQAENVSIVCHPDYFFAGYPSFVPLYSYEAIMTISADNVEVSGLTLSHLEKGGTPSDLASHSLGTTPAYDLYGGGSIILNGSSCWLHNNVFNDSLCIYGSFANITDNKFVKNGGIIDIHSSYNKLIANTIIGSTEAIHIGGSSNEIRANTLKGTNFSGTGLLINGDWNRISENKLSLFDTALVMYQLDHEHQEGDCSNNVIQNNQIQSNDKGLWISGGNNNIFTENAFVNNTALGIIRSSVNVEGASTKVQFYANNFVGEVNNFTITDSQVVFDLYGAGNFWSDYKTKYPNAKEIGNSGIGDTAYAVGDGGYVDYYPLVRPTVNSGVIFAPQISVISPMSQCYNSSSVPLMFLVDRVVNWTAYSLDCQDNVTITGNSTLSLLSNGQHNITVFTGSLLDGLGASEIVIFLVNETSLAKTELLGIVTPAIITTAVIIAVVTVFLAFYWRHKHAIVERSH